MEKYIYFYTLSLVNVSYIQSQNKMADFFFFDALPKIAITLL